MAAFFSRAVVVYGVCLLAVVAVACMIVTSLQRSDYFLVRQLIIREKDDISNGEVMFAYLKGKNIFTVDLDREAARIAMAYPSYRKIRLTRYLPDCILVDFLRRIPVACIRADKTYYVDNNGYLFDQPGIADLPGLPAIAGIERKISSLRMGGTSTVREVGLSLQVISRIGQDKAFAGYRLRTIDVSAPGNLVFFLYQPKAVAQELGKVRQEENEAIEVRLGVDAIPAKIQILSSVLTQMRSTVGNIKYIDLRFKEPVIKFKNMEKFARK